MVNHAEKVGEGVGLPSAKIRRFCEVQKDFCVFGGRRDVFVRERGGIRLGFSRYLAVI